ncbi:Elongator complex protein 5 [Scheffersomyces xylosifermentans]|uniref:Elongator complex protein 5 n=1 Tax=Scheffersomyces xylosifermentans TaxID=1304137 RepID=UPI00315C9F77
MSNQNSTVLLTRLLSLKENSPFLLVLDSLSQSSHYLIREFPHRCSSNNKILYLSYETANKVPFASEFLDCTTVSSQQIASFVKQHSNSTIATGSSTIAPSKTLVIIDSLNYIPNNEITQFLTSIIQPSIAILGTFHTNIPQPQSALLNYPSALTIFSFIASSIFEVEAIHEQFIDEESLENRVNRLDLPVNAGLNSNKFKLTLTNRRKSGRSVIYKFTIDSENHVYEQYKASKEEEIDPEDESLLKGLTTFNLTTNSKQKLAREQVELPYLEAQEAMGASGGAIVYEYEKDDDYDEEDPYEDPF